MSTTVYEERLFSRWITLLLGVVTAVMFLSMMGQFQLGASSEVPIWVFPLMFVVFLLVTLNFAWLTIRITDEQLVVAYGVARHVVRWDQVEDCYIDEASSVWYGGYGIRVGWYKGKRRLIYNTIGDPRVVLLTRNASTPEFVFSTAQPEEVVSRVREHLRSLKR